MENTDDFNNKFYDDHAIIAPTIFPKNTTTGTSVEKIGDVLILDEEAVADFFDWMIYKATTLSPVDCVACRIVSDNDLAEYCPYHDGYFKGQEDVVKNLKVTVEYNHYRHVLTEKK